MDGSNGTYTGSYSSSLTAKDINGTIHTNYPGLHFDGPKPFDVFEPFFSNSSEDAHASKNPSPNWLVNIFGTGKTLSPRVDGLPG